MCVVKRLLISKKCNIFRTTILGTEGYFPSHQRIYSHCISVSSIKISHSKDSTFTAGICLVSIGLGSPRVIGLVNDGKLQYQSGHVYPYQSKWVSTGPNGRWNLKSIIVLLCLCTRSSWAPESSLEVIVNKIFTSSRLISAHVARSFLRKFLFPFPFLFPSCFLFPGFPVLLVSLVPRPFKCVKVWWVTQLWYGSMAFQSCKTLFSELQHDWSAIAPKVSMS